MSEVRLEVKPGVFLVFDPTDIEAINVSSHRGFDTGDDGHVFTRTPNGNNTITLHIEFNHGKHETWEQG